MLKISWMQWQTSSQISLQPPFNLSQSIKVMPLRKSHSQMMVRALKVTWMRIDQIISQRNLRRLTNLNLTIYSSIWPRKINRKVRTPSALGSFLNRRCPSLIPMTSKRPWLEEIISFWQTFCDSSTIRAKRRLNRVLRTLKESSGIISASLTSLPVTRQLRKLKPSWMPCFTGVRQTRLHASTPLTTRKDSCPS